MSIKFTKTFEIDENGDCGKCLSEARINSCLSVCLAFGNIVDDYIQCQECKDFLEEDKLWNAKLPNRGEE